MIKVWMLVLSALIVGAFLGYNIRPHQYAVQVISNPQDNGHPWHDVLRVDLTTGTMCSLMEDTTIVNSEIVSRCHQ